MYYMDPSRSGRYAVRRALGLLLLMGGMMLLLFLVMGLFANGGIGGIFSSILRGSSHLFLLILGNGGRSNSTAKSNNGDAEFAGMGRGIVFHISGNVVVEMIKKCYVNA